MQIEKYNKAKELKEKIDRLYSKYLKLQHAKANSTVHAVIHYQSYGKFPSNMEFTISNTERVQALVLAEYEAVSKELEELQKEFDNL